MRGAALVAAVLLSGCYAGHHRQLSPGTYEVQCLRIAECYQEANKACPSGYDTEMSGSSGTFQDGFGGESKSNEMVITCK